MTKRKRGRPRKLAPSLSPGIRIRTVTDDGKPVRGRPQTRIDTAMAAADAVARLTRKGKSVRAVRQQVAQELGYLTPLGEEYIRQQVDWYDRHIPEIFADDWYEAARERQEDHDREQASLKDAAD